jgi:1,4-alpha-glucan branching enzyme
MIRLKLKYAVIPFATFLLVSIGGMRSLAQSSRPGMGSIPYGDVSGTGVTFRVWAPHATSVSVAGTFNNWNGTAHPLTQEGVTGIWSRDVSTARANAQYKYVINGQYWWKDPRSRMVTTSGFNSSGANSIVYDPNAFKWNGDTLLNFNGANSVIYEMHVGAFFAPNSGHPGKFTDAATKLDQLAALGINAVELLPINEFPGDYSWGYNPSDIFAVENSGYGGPDGLKTFVKQAHLRGIRVLLDVVHNHWGPNDLELYGFDLNYNNGATYFYTDTASGICCTQWGPRPNFSSEGVRSFIIDNIAMWQNEYHIDGFRWDSVGSMRQYNVPNTSTYNTIPEGDSLLQYINTSVMNPASISIAEDQAGNLGFGAQWNMELGSTLINQVTASLDADRDMNALQSSLNGYGFNRVNFTETHDWVGFSNGSGAQRVPVRINPGAADGYYARKRSMLAAAAILTVPGIPMMFMGQEMLTTNQFNDSTPLNWSNTDRYPAVVQFYHDLIRLKRNLDGVSPGLVGPSITWHVQRNDLPFKLLAYHRWGSANDDQVMVILNFSSNTVNNYSMNDWPADGTWYVNLNSDSTFYSGDFGNQGSSTVSVSGGSGAFSIGPYSALVLSRQNLAAVQATPIQFTNVQNQGTNISLTWTAPPGMVKILQKAASLTGAWQDIATNLPPTSSTVTTTLSTSANPSPCYFRIKAHY